MWPFIWRIISILAVNRSKEAILAQILNVATVPSKKTHIMYSALLSFSQLNSYLKYLEDRQLIIRINEDDAWMVTGAGREYLKQYKILANSLK